MDALQHRLLFSRKVGDDPMQEQRCFVQETFGRLDVFENDAFCKSLQAGLFVAVQVLAGKDDDRHFGKGRVGAHLLEQLETGHVRQPQVEDDAIEALIAHELQRLRPRRRGHDFDILVVEHPDHGLTFDIVIFDDQQPPGARCREFLYAIEGRHQPLCRWLLDKICEGAVGKAVLTLFLQSNDLHRNVTRSGIELELVQNGPAEHVGKEYIQRDSRGTKLSSKRKTHGSFQRYDSLETVIACEVEQDAGVVWIVFDDQQHGIAINNLVTIVFDPFFAGWG